MTNAAAIPLSSNGRTADFESANRGSNPRGGTSGFPLSPKTGTTKLIEVQDGLCAYCCKPFSGLGGKHPLAPSLDHVWPRAYGRTKVNNVLVVHYACNHRKGSRKPNACELIMLDAVNVRRTIGCAGTMPGMYAPASVDTHAKRRDSTQIEALSPMGSAVAKPDAPPSAPSLQTPQGGDS